METKTIYLTIRVDYTCNKPMDEEQSAEIATTLAINPNYHTIEEGVALDYVNVCAIEF